MMTDRQVLLSLLNMQASQLRIFDTLHQLLAGMVMDAQLRAGLPPEFSAWLAAHDPDSSGEHP